MKLLETLKKPFYAIIAIVSVLAMLSIYIYAQLLGALQNLDIWFIEMPWYNSLLLGIFVALFGATFSYQVSLWRGPKTCSISTKAKGLTSSAGGTFGLFLVTQCPACTSLGTLFLPISALAFITQYSWFFNLISIALLLFTLNYLGAFKKTGVGK